MSGKTGIASEIGQGLGRRAKVLAVESDDVVRVSPAAGKGDLLCDVLVSSDNDRPHFSPGDEVFIVAPNGNEARGLVLGRIGPSVDSAPPKEIPEELVIEARKGLVIRVGEGSITIRADGKILIKGKDLVSHARRTNRIKGGAVSLN